MQTTPFLKMHGLGNDFVVLDQREAAIELDPAWVRAVADRHRGIGFDQLVVLRADPDADARVIFYNADGSTSGACGNAMRCVARLIGDSTGQDRLRLRTAVGLLSATRAGAGIWTIDMGAPRRAWQEVPLAQACDTTEVPLDFEDLPRPVAVSMGNPHAVFIVPDLRRADVERQGRILERHPMFPERANIGFAQVVEPTRMRLRVFERGTGLTQACGSGACAAMVAGRLKGLLAPEATLVLDGGELRMAWDGEGGVRMTGPASYVARGEILPEIAA